MTYPHKMLSPNSDYTADFISEADEQAHADLTDIHTFLQTIGERAKMEMENLIPEHIKQHFDLSCIHEHELLEIFDDSVHDAQQKMEERE